MGSIYSTLFVLVLGLAFSIYRLIACSLVERKMEELTPTSMEAVKSPQQEAKDLLKWAFGSKWDKVVKRYKLNPETHTVRITRSRDTALHIAFLDQKEGVVEELVRLIDEAAAKKPTDKGNASESDDSLVKEEGRTPNRK